MYWLNVDQLKTSIDNPSAISPVANLKPQQRWGQSCVSANNRIYILGGYEGSYLGDVWFFDFQALQFAEVQLEGEDRSLLSRSNHTAVFYKPHNSIYVFGGGQAQKMRFNDTVRVQLPDESNSRKPFAQKAKVTKMVLQDNTPLPLARTYHASCLVQKYMVVIGGEATSDLRDFWALDLESGVWCKPDVAQFECFTPKRFHSASAISETQVVTFGGCHSEYLHMNEMHIFEMTNFLLNPSDQSQTVICTKINVTEGIPSTRWGHAASTYEGKLYVLGGRNEQDIIDLHEFDLAAMKWKEVELTGVLPKARRRHSALFVSGSLIMFGGFDGNFFNDLNILDFQRSNKQVLTIQPSTIDQDYLSLVNMQETADIEFVLDCPSRPHVYGHKALILFRAIERELFTEITEDHQLSILMTKETTPDFFRNIYYANKGQSIFLKGISCKAAFVKFLEYLYCDKLVEHTVPMQVRQVAEICRILGLSNIQSVLKKKADVAKHKIHQNIIKELQSKQPGNENLSLNSHQQKQLVARVNQLESQMKIDFSQIEEVQVQSPEDKYERLHNKALSHMNQCKNLDEFYDIIFHVDDTLIKANSLILATRCPYFESMFSTKYEFQESQVKESGVIQVSGVPKSFFTCIIQYIYSDHFYISNEQAEFFIKLMIYADYFMLPRLVDICSSYLKQFVNVKTVLQIMLIAHAHNADQLETYCINFFALNEKEITESRGWRHFKRQAQESLIQCFLQKLRDEQEESFVQIAIHQFISKYSKKDTQQLQLAKEQESSKRQLRHQFNLKDNSNYMQMRNGMKEEELDIDELLNTANYIYLEEHHKYDSYDYTAMIQQLVGPLPCINAKPSKKQGVLTEKKISMFGSEELKEGNYKMADYNYNEDKENVSLYSNLQTHDRENVQATKNVLNTIQSIPISSKNRYADPPKSGLFNMVVSKKKREVKRMPLQDLNDQAYESSNPYLQQIIASKRGKTQESEDQQDGSKLHRNQNCRIFQDR